MTDSKAPPSDRRASGLSWRRLLPWVPAAVVLVLFLARAWTLLVASADDVAPAATSTSSAVRSASSSALLPATKKTTESVRPVITPVAPLLTGLGKRRRVASVLHSGELVTLIERLPSASWLGSLDGQRAERQGPLLRVRRAVGEAPYLTYESDVGPAVEVPSAQLICDRLTKRPTMLPSGSKPCAERLRRARFSDGRLLAYAPCNDRCPVALLKGDALSAIQVDGVVDGKLLDIDGKRVLALTARYNQAGGKLTGGTLVLVALGAEAPIRGGAIELDRIDARDSVNVVSRVGTIEFRGNEVRFVGAAKVVVRDSAKELSSKPIDEHYRIAPDASVARE